MRIQDLVILLAFVITAPLQAQTQSTSGTQPAKTEATPVQERVVTQRVLFWPRWKLQLDRLRNAGRCRHRDVASFSERNTRLNRDCDGTGGPRRHAK
jgi:hypothetical protein